VDAPEDFSHRPSRVRFLGNEAGTTHRRWFKTIAEHYDAMYNPDRPRLVAEFLHDIFGRHGPVGSVLDVGCGTFSIDLELLERGYEVVGCDASPHMLAVARRRLRETGKKAELVRAAMEELDLKRRFDAVLCLGTAFNYLYAPKDWKHALRRFRNHLRPDGLLVLDLTNFASWIDDPTNVRAETDYRAPDGTRIAIFVFNEQNAAKTQHLARFLTIVQRDDALDIGMDEAILKVWHKEALAESLGDHGLRPTEWWGDLEKGAQYVPSESSRLVCVAIGR
jgi:SAM-dependent methyltransferase